jgi:hypothetical protein
MWGAGPVRDGLGDFAEDRLYGVSLSKVGPLPVHHDTECHSLQFVPAKRMRRLPFKAGSDLSSTGSRSIASNGRFFNALPMSVRTAICVDSWSAVLRYVP